MPINQQNLARLSGLLLCVASFTNVLKAQPITLDTSLALDTLSPTVGEPVILKLSIENKTPTPCRVKLGAGYKAKLRFQVTEPTGEGKMVPQFAPNGFTSAGAVTIPSERRFTREYVVDEWYDFVTPADYVIHAALLIPITCGASTKASQNVENTFRISLWPRDVNRLSSVFETFLRRVLDSGDPNDSEAAARILLAVKDPFVVPYLVRALNTSVFPSHGIAVRALGKFAYRDEAIDPLLSIATGSDEFEAMWAKGVLLGATPQMPEEIRLRVRRLLENSR